MNTHPKGDYKYDISEGKIYHTSKQWKFGEGIITTLATTVWTGSTLQPGTYIYPPETGVVMDVVGTAVGDTTQIMIFQGLDKHWKSQEELIQLNGTTPVTTQYAYSRINRMSVLGGGGLTGEVRVYETGTTSILYSHIDNGLFDRNQTQQAFISIPAGFELLAESVDITSYGGKKTNLYIVVRDWGLAEELGLSDPPFRIQLNWNLFNTTYQPITGVPIQITEKIDVELRGFTENATDSVTSILQGVNKQVHSVPIDLLNYTLTPGVEEILVSWDGQTPAETSDLQAFVVDITDDLDFNKQFIITDHTSTGVLVGDLVTGTTYTVTAFWQGFDGLKSTIESDTAVAG